MDWDYGLVAAQEGQLWAINHHLQKNNYVLVSFLVERKNVLDSICLFDSQSKGLRYNWKTLLLT